MLISKDWLSDYIKTPLSDERLSEILTSIGLEVEKIHYVDQIRGGLNGLIVGEIISLEKHPNADRLSCTKIDIGTKSSLNIVCGATNISVGQKVPVATVGTRLYPSEDEEGFKIKKGKIRGEISEGMLCSESEIGIGKSHDGILILDKKAIKGLPLAKHLQIEPDTVFEIGLTPNRMDAMSHMGVARDLRAALSHKNLEYHWLGEDPDLWNEANENIELKIIEKSICPIYKGLGISGLKNKNSPEWLKRRLNSIGLKSINAIVDITNYVLNDTGHPLHAFDINKIQGDKIIVRKAKNKEKITTLDGIERTLNQDDLVIADEKKAIAIAGVFGGGDSGVSIKSTDIFIESAWFDPVSIRKTAKRHGLNTDASFRYERGVDPNIGEYSLKMAWKLILRIFPEAYVESYSEKKSEKFNLDNRTLEVDLIKINKLIGHDIKVTDVKSILKSLDIQIKKESKSKLKLSIPLYRWDVTREADIAEEILRIYGFNSIPLPKHIRVSERKGTSISNDSIRKKATDFLVAKGFYEIMNNSLTSSKLYSDHPSLNSENNVNIINPLSQELEIMRPSMLLGGLDVIGYNQKRQQSNIFIFEFGRVYNKSKNSEQNQLAIWHSGQYPLSSWNSKKSKTDFFSLKGLIEGLFAYLGIHDMDEETLIPKQGEWGHGVKLLSNQKTLGKIFWVDDWAKNISDIKGDILASNIDWDALFEIVQLSKMQYHEISKFPHVNRDLAIIIRSEITYSDIKKTILEVKEKTLCKIQLFDVFQSEKLGKNLISYGVRLTFEDLKKTLKDKQVENSIKKIVEALKVKIGGEIRSS